MIRTLTGGQQAEIAASKSSHYWLLSIDTDIPLLMTTAYKDIDYDGDTYRADTFILDLPTIDDDLDLKVRRYKFKLSAVNQINTAYFLLNAPYYRRVKIYKLWLDSGGAMVGDPIIRFSGYFANFSNKINQSSGESTQEIEAVSDFVDFDRKNGRQSNDASQQRIFPGDTGLRHSETKYENLPWGRP